MTNLTGRRSIDNPDKTLLDEFAMAAMRGILAAKDRARNPSMIAEWAYEQALAMLAEKRRLEAL